VCRSFGSTLAVVINAILVVSSDVHGNGEYWDPMCPMGFP